MVSAVFGNGAYAPIDVICKNEKDLWMYRLESY
jgi:hypothetical protein